MPTRQSGRDFVLDLGTSTVRLAHVTPGKYTAPAEGEAPVVELPALTLMDAERHTVVALGTQAAAIARATLPSGVEVVRPLREGRIAAYDPAVALVRAALHAALGGESALRRLTRRPRVLYALPATASAAERILMQDILRAAGFGAITPVPAALVTALGAELSIKGNRPHAVCDLGAGLVKVAIVVNGQVQLARSWPAGGDWLNGAVGRAVRRKHGITITAQMAEDARREFGTLADDYDYRHADQPAAVGTAEPAEGALVQKRRGLGTGQLLAKVGAGGTFGKVGGSGHSRSRLPEFHTDDIETGLREGARALIAPLALFWEDLDPALREAVDPVGLLLTGGLAQLPGLARAIGRTLGAPVAVAADPVHAALRGLSELGADRASWRSTWTWPPAWEPVS